VPLFATLDALLSTLDGDVGWCLHATTWGRLPASLGWMKHGRLIAGGVLGSEAARLLKCVPKKVAILTLERALCAVLSSALVLPW
jgi:hypothetical protein